MKPVIIKKLDDILKRNFKITIKKEDRNKHLLGKNCQLNPRDLLYLFFFIQEEFNIRIDRNYILDGTFSTIDNIVEIVYKALQAQEILG